MGFERFLYRFWVAICVLFVIVLATWILILVLPTDWMAAVLGICIVLSAGGLIVQMIKTGIRGLLGMRW